MLRVFELSQSGAGEATGLNAGHPLMRFAADPSSLARAQALDDTVLWGALPMMAEAADEHTRLRSQQLLRRDLLRCVDIWHEAAANVPDRLQGPGARLQRTAFINLVCETVLARKD